MRVFRPLCILLITCLLLAGCSNSFVYNRLDFLITWYVDDYVDLTANQKKELKQRLQPALDWHRQEELLSYIDIIDGIKSDVSTPVNETDVSNWTSAFLQAFQRIQLGLVDVILGFSDELDDKQMQEFQQNLLLKHKELEEKYLARDDEAYIEDNYERLEDNLEDYLGYLNKQQQATLRRAVNSLQRLDRVWLADRAEWLESLLPLLDRVPGWKTEIRNRYANRASYRSSDYKHLFEHNMTIINRAITDVLNQRDERQQKVLLTELDEFRKELKTLMAQGNENKPEPQRQFL